MAESIHTRTPLERALANLVRIGRVSSVDKGKHTARVEFTEIDGQVSSDLQVLVTRPGDYSLPPVGALVVCLILPGESGIGYVLGAIYSGSDAAPLDDEGQRSIASDDLRLGAPDATDHVAIAEKVKDELDAIKAAFNNHAHLAGTLISSPGGGAVSGATAPVTTSYNPNAVAAEKVKVK